MADGRKIPYIIEMGINSEKLKEKCLSGIGKKLLVLKI
jgi:hypothetical protein